MTTGPGIETEINMEKKNLVAGWCLYSKTRKRVAVFKKTPTDSLSINPYVEPVKV